MRKLIAAEVTFYFETSEVKAKDYEKFNAKIQRFVNNNEFALSAILLVQSDQLTAIIEFDVTNCNAKNVYDYLAPKLTRLIDAHKEPATYGWAHNTIAKVVA